MSPPKIVQPKLGLWLLTALVAGNMIGSGVFLLPSALASFGSIGIVAWVFTSIGAILLALVFAQLSRVIPKVGGPYAYCRAGFGEYIGFFVAYNYWIAVWVGNAGIAVAFTGYLSVFWPEIAANHTLGFIVAASAIWILTFINIVGIRYAGMLQLVTTILKILPLILVAAVGIFFINGHELVTNFNVSGQPTFTALSSAAVITLWAFVGLESATIPAEAALNPQKTIARATILGTSISAFIYIFSTIAVMGILPLDTLSHSSAPYADAAAFLFGHWGAWLVAAGAVIACFGALNGWTLLQGQVPMAAGRDKLFPAVFAKESKRGTPYVGLIISSILITCLLLLTLKETLVEQFTFIILLATLSSLIPYFLTAMSQLLILIKHREAYHVKRVAPLAIVAVLAGLYAYWAISGAGVSIIYYGCLLMFTSAPVYVWMKWHNSREEAALETNAAEVEEAI